MTNKPNIFKRQPRPFPDRSYLPKPFNELREQKPGEKYSIDSCDPFLPIYVNLATLVAQSIE